VCGLHGNTAGRAIGKSALAHRGPDGYGIFKSDDVVLEHWRLSIIDLSSNGDQPMRSGNDSLVIAYNGEVYNFRELRDQLGGEQFKSATDTEVVLRLYERYGLDCLLQLNGMFALAIYDRSKRRIVLARDRFGIKPLYYHIHPDSSLSFASELKALTLNHSIDLTIDVAAVQSLFHLLYIEGQHTPFEAVKKVPPGSYLIYDLDTKSVQIRRYHEFSFAEHQTPEPACIQRIDDLLAESVRMHLISDVPVGALLSGGVDSSLLVAMMSRYSPDIHTFAIGHGAGSPYDESRYSDLVAKQYNTQHHHKVIPPGAIGALVDRVCAVLDEPIGDTSVFLNFFVFGFVSESVKVCLSGLGGDELFGGYNRYLACKLLPIYANIPQVFRDGLMSLIELMPASRASRIGNKVRHVKSFLTHADPDLGRSYRSFIDYFSRPGFSPVVSSEQFTNSRFDAYWDDKLLDKLNRIYRYDIENYMVNDLLFLTDRMSMQHSLEARVPYLENNFVDFALGIAPGSKIKRLTMKHLLKKVAERYLPANLIYRRKQGFSSPTSGLLTETTLQSLLNELDKNDAQYMQILNRSVFIELIGEHQRGEDNSLQIFTLLVYVKWMRNFFSEKHGSATPASCQS
jgi:asparagine synthase (glutamine-hydrolysing)